MSIKTASFCAFSAKSFSAFYDYRINKNTKQEKLEQNEK